METQTQKRFLGEATVTLAEETSMEECSSQKDNTEKSDITEDRIWDGLNDEWGLYIDRMLPGFPDLGKPLSDRPKDEAAAASTMPNKFLLLETFEKNKVMLQRVAKNRTCLATELLKMERSDWCEGLHHKMDEMVLKGYGLPELDEDKPVELEESQGIKLWGKYGLKELEEGLVEAVKPYLQQIKSFRQCIVDEKFEKAHGVLDEILKNVDRTKYRKDVIESLHRIATYGTQDSVGSPNTRSKLNSLKNRLQGLKNEQSKPETIEEIFKQNNWPTIKKVYETKKDKLSKKQLNKVLLMAARTRSWPEFWSCVDRGADIVNNGSMPPSCTAEHKAKCPSIHDIKVDTDGPTDSKRRKLGPQITGLSPLHEALKTGELLLEKLEKAFKNDPSLVNAMDESGDYLLHLVVMHGLPDTRLKNVKFLLKHKVNVNATDAKGKTALQYALHPRFSSWEAGLIVEMVLETDCIAEHTWQAGPHDWTALHVLCATGLHQHIVPFVQKGADTQDLRYGLTLIDTVVLQDGMARDLKEKTLAVLLEDPIKLGPFHAQVVKARSSPAAVQQQRKYQRFLICGKNYLYPLERLLFPLVSTQTVRTAYKHFVRMMLDGEAVCEKELRFVESKLHLIQEEYQELREYLKPFLELN